MTKILFYTDLHKGADYREGTNSPVTIYGSTAFLMNAAILAYAADNENHIDAVISGGDEATYIADMEHHFRRATEIDSTMRAFKGELHRVIGNHELWPRLNLLGFRKESYRRIFNRQTRIKICQPVIGRVDGHYVHKYDGDRMARPLRRVKSGTQRNRILFGHWAFNRMQRGYPEYNKDKRYLDTSAEVLEHMQRINGEEGQRVVGVHGHEHSFSWQDNCLVMPSISQEDVDHPEKPCGLFVEISDDGPNNTLRFEFKRIINYDCDLFEPIETETVSVEYMRRYHRPMQELAA